MSPVLELEACILQTLDQRLLLPFHAHQALYPDRLLCQLHIPIPDPVQ